MLTLFDISTSFFFETLTSSFLLKHIKRLKRWNNVLLSGDGVEDPVGVFVRDGLSLSGSQYNSYALNRSVSPDIDNN